MRDRPERQEGQQLPIMRQQMLWQAQCIYESAYVGLDVDVNVTLNQKNRCIALKIQIAKILPKKPGELPRR
jgi:hypothetical protein